MDRDLELHEPRPRTAAEKGVIFTLWAVLLVAFLAGCVRRLAGRRVTSTTRSTTGAGSTLLQDVRNFFSDAGVNEEMKAAVNQRMRALKLSRLRIFLFAGTVSFFPWVLITLSSLVRGSVPQGSTPLEDILWVALEVFGAVIFARPTLVTVKNMDVITVVLMLWCSINHTPWACCTQEAIESPPGGKFLIMLGLIFVRGVSTREDWLLLLLGNAVYHGCSIYTSWIIYRREETWLAAVENNVFWMITTVVTFIMAATIDAGERKVRTQGLQLAEVREMHKAATALLRSSYDVLVELDSSGVVRGTSQELGSLLLRANHNRSMEGVELATLLLDEDDRKSFQRRLAAPRSKTVGLAENMHVSMKDTLGNTLRMEMMWFACQRVEGPIHFVVGIREFSDQAQVAPDSGSGMSPGHGHGYSGADNYFASPWPVTCEGSSSSEDSISVSQPATVDVDAAPAMVVLDLTAGDRPIRGVTSGFRSSIGHVSRNAPLSRIVRRHQLMVNWMESAVNSLVNGEPLPEDHTVTLQMPHGRIRAKCRLVVTEVEDDAPPVDFENVVVLFYNVSQPKPRSGPSSNPRHGTPATTTAHQIPDPAHAVQHPSASADPPGEERDPPCALVTSI